jgi:SSS family solute:Na+ symporter
MAEKLIMMGLFIAVTVAIGIACRRHAGDVNSFVLGGRNVGPWLTAFAYGTSYFSSVVFIGYAGQFGYGFGVAATWIGIGNALIGSLMAWKLLGRRTRIMTKHFEAATMPDFFAKRYNSKALRIVSALVIFIFLVPYSASVYKGLSGLFSITFGIDFVWCVYGVALLTGIYVVLGGYIATAVNDLVQGIIMIAGVCMVIISVLNGKGGFSDAIKLLSTFPAQNAPGLEGAYVSFFGPDPLSLLWVVILTSMGTWGLPQMVHKFYTIRDEAAIHKGTVISTIFAIIIAGGSYFMGAFGRLYYTPVDGKVMFDEIVPLMISQTLPDILIGVVLILVLSASMSTLSSLVLASSSTVTLDFLTPISPTSVKGERGVRIIKLLCITFIALSVALALIPNSLITTLMSLSWGALAGSFLGPFLYALTWRKATAGGVWACMLSGIGITTLNFFIPFAPSPVAAGSFAILASLIVMPIASLLTPRSSPERVADAFACYEESVVTRSKFILDDGQS